MVELENVEVLEEHAILSNDPTSGQEKGASERRVTEKLFSSIRIRFDKNKAVYTTASVACG